jgi:hypothetical protein
MLFYKSKPCLRHTFMILGFSPQGIDCIVLRSNTQGGSMAYQMLANTLHTMAVDQSETTYRMH